MLACVLRLNQQDASQLLLYRPLVMVQGVGGPAHCTITNGRNCSSVLAPMPGTRSRSSTLA
jgi:hypothetical protein